MNSIQKNEVHLYVFIWENLQLKMGKKHLCKITNIHVYITEKIVIPEKLLIVDFLRVWDEWNIDISLSIL